jgi:hypothetical protein
MYLEMEVATGSQPFDASEPRGRDFTFVLTPSSDYFEPRVLDASDMPAILEEGSDVLLGEPARPWEGSVLTETHHPIEAGRTQHGVNATDQQFHIRVGEYVEQPAVGYGVERLSERGESQRIALNETYR